MPEPTKIRATLRDGVADVRALIAHEMESGQRRDASGKVVAPWHVTDVTATLNGTPVMRAHWGPGVSKNPLLQFKVRGVKAGDRIAIAWVDSRGERRSDEITVG